VALPAEDFEAERAPIISDMPRVDFYYDKIKAPNILREEINRVEQSREDRPRRRRCFNRQARKLADLPILGAHRINFKTIEFVGGESIR